MQRSLKHILKDLNYLLNKKVSGFCIEIGIMENNVKYILTTDMEI